MLQVGEKASSSGQVQGLVAEQQVASSAIWASGLLWPDAEVQRSVRKGRFQKTHFLIEFTYLRNCKTPGGAETLAISTLTFQIR